ncbi:hypothetical protein HPB51_008556 [Rhipicephalus microplus]|uniref:Uncharacterized protein n=1 Tax=Rhipicephalus microplus TaxID=6941 RepID=A0A9J6D4J4_RHIMP|nr:hypothetical protein HPB51_008556 [Rhipicephalus microplus]
MEVVEVEETQVAPEDATLEAGWITSHRNKQRKHASNAPASPTGQGSASDTPMLNGSAQRLSRKPRQPRLPDDHVKVVIRPRNGLNFSQVRRAQLCDAILREVDLHAMLLKEDIYRTCVEANLIVVSTPHLSSAEIYSRISKLQVKTETYDVRAYVTSPENTAKGVIHNILRTTLLKTSLQVLLITATPRYYKLAEWERQTRYSLYSMATKSLSMSTMEEPNTNVTYIKSAPESARSAGQSATARMSAPNQMP